MRLRRRGLTLLEVLIASTIFLGLSLVLVASFQSTQRMETKSDAQSDAFRRVQTVLAHLSSELRGAQLVEPVDLDTPSASAVYRKPEVVDGRLKLGGTGIPIWMPAATVYVDGDHQVRQTKPDGTERFLADLGAEGELTFTRPTDDTLNVVVVATVVDPEDRILREGRFRAERLFYFANQP